MLARLLRPLLSLIMEVLEEESPRLLAASVAFGMLFGFVPKDNLIAVLLGFLMLALRFNLPLVTSAAAIFSGVAALLDPIADALGRAVLTHPLFAELWLELYRIPLVPWTRFNNTVVMGSLLLASGLLTPVYLGSLKLVQWYRPLVIIWVRQFGFVRVLGTRHLPELGENA